MSEVGWGRPHTSSDSDCNPSRNPSSDSNGMRGIWIPGQRNPIVSEGEFRLGLQSESELLSDFTARISPSVFSQIVDTQRNCKIIKKPVWNSRSGNPKRLPVSSRSAPGQTPGQLPVSSRSAPGQLPVSPGTPGHGTRARNPSKTWYGGIGEALIMKDCDVLL